MGRYGGFELSYGCDADVLFVHEPVDGGRRAARRRRTPRRWPTSCAGCSRCPGTDPALSRRRRPAARGQAGRRWCGPWTPTPPTTPSGRRCGRRRRCCAPTRSWATWTCAGGSTELVDPLRYPAGGISEDDVVEVRRIKARVDEERLPRGADRKTHLKLGRGGLADIEWTVQLLQMRYAGQVPGLRTSRTLPALAAAQEAGLLADEDAALLAHAWRRVSRIRNAVTLVRGSPSDALPSRPPGAGGGRRDPRLRRRHLRADGRRLPADDAARARGRRAGLLGVGAGPTRPHPGTPRAEGPCAADAGPWAGGPCPRTLGTAAPAPSRARRRPGEAR